MTRSRTTPSWPRVVSATLAAMAVCFPLGMAAEFVWTHWFVASGAFLLLALVSMRLHPRRGRIAGVSVDPGRAAASQLHPRRAASRQTERVRSPKPRPPQVQARIGTPCSPPRIGEPARASALQDRISMLRDAAEDWIEHRKKRASGASG